ncbi:MAG: phosphatase PAP2 family protein [Candidatus Nitrospinota bacterium M3_3B_026]
MGALIRLDEALFFWINNGWACPALDALMSLASVAGDAGVLVLFGLTAILFWDKAGRRRMVPLFLAAMAAGGVSLVALKAVVDRDRPMERFKEEIRMGTAEVRAPLRPLFARSFPSGHSQAAFTAAAFFALYYRRRRAALYAAAAMVALSRVYLGAHFPLDILAGSALGWLIAWLVWRIGKMARGGKSPSPQAADAV